jgi:hypothetical protein
MNPIKETNSIESPVLVQCDLSNPYWRDDNLDTLEEWHPYFGEVSEELRAILKRFSRAMAVYSRILLKGSDEPQDDLLRHLDEEVCMWMERQMQSVVKEVWEKADTWIDQKDLQITKSTQSRFRQVAATKLELGDSVVNHGAVRWLKEWDGMIHVGFMSSELHIKPDWMVWIVSR